MRCRRPGLAGGLAFWIALTAAGSAWAHNLGVQGKLRAGRVEVEAYFDDDTPARGAKVKVLTGRQEVIAAGRTDRDGRWSFPAPEAGTYQVEVDAGAGHRTTTQITVPGQRPSAGKTPPPEKGAARDQPLARAQQPVPISDSPDKDEFVRFPWLGILLGVGIIGAGSLGLWWLLRGGGKAPTGTDASWPDGAGPSL